MSEQDLITIDEKGYRQLKELYLEAKEKSETQFNFKGRTILVAYCKYLLEYRIPRRRDNKKRGKDIQPTIK